MLGETMSQLGDEDDEDKVEEELEEGHTTIHGAVFVTGRRLPPAPKRGSSGHGEKLPDHLVVIGIVRGHMRTGATQLRAAATKGAVRRR